eukprot:CAMPEP_0195647850 /NCGR_PEP_ID=MMETSP0815-20121206/30319_1 /TAXON_ID=97485 /ORGANISM="Prymnesium parvum, Strain Texoma1" /LENGTH=131 /DNA_ID=CAMNT_0040791447 /DNA_START=1 /DNA_END=397 /DNA_ORIENTATION=-
MLLAESLRATLLLLGHRYPKVRKTAADLLYVHFLTYGDPGALAPLRRGGRGAAGGADGGAARDAVAGWPRRRRTAGAREDAAAAAAAAPQGEHGRAEAGGARGPVVQGVGRRSGLLIDAAIERVGRSRSWT